MSFFQLMLDLDLLGLCKMAAPSVEIIAATVHDSWLALVVEIVY